MVRRRILAGAGLVLVLACSSGDPSRAGNEPAKPSGDSKPAANAGDTKPAAAAGDTKQAGSADGKSSASHPKCPYTTQDCLNHMAARLKASGWIGIEYEPAEDGTVTVQKVVAGSPAEKAGLQPGDILYSINGVEIRKGNDEAMAKIDRRPGQTIHYVIKRNGVAKPIDIVLGQWPADLLAKYIGEHMLEHAEADALAQGPPK
jgi:membrane-associated protease RseP (regulator of RpoE activity)